MCPLYHTQLIYGFKIFIVQGSANYHPWDKSGFPSIFDQPANKERFYNFLITGKSKNNIL